MRPPISPTPHAALLDGPAGPATEAGRSLLLRILERLLLWSPHLRGRHRAPLLPDLAGRLGLTFAESAAIHQHLTGVEASRPLQPPG
jgi:hypothetical protein